jgi:hypothetical protein
VLGACAGGDNARPGQSRRCWRRPGPLNRPSTRVFGGQSGHFTGQAGSGGAARSARPSVADRRIAFDRSPMPLRLNSASSRPPNVLGHERVADQPAPSSGGEMADHPQEHPCPVGGVPETPVAICRRLIDRFSGRFRPSGLVRTPAMLSP